MNCPKCQIIEMRVDRVEDNVIHYRCKKCGNEETITQEELENKENMSI